MIDLAQELQELISTQEIDWNQVKVLESKLVQKIGSKPRNSFSLNGMWLSTIGDSSSQSIGTWFNIDLGKWLKSDKDTRVNIESKFGTESKNWGSVSHSYSSSISEK